MGYPEEELLKRPLVDFVYKDDFEMVNGRGVARQSGEDIIHEYSFRMLTKQGDIRTVSLRVDAIWDNEGVPTTIGSLNDITETRKTERALAHSQDDIQQILDNLPDVFYRTDMNGIIQLMSPSCEDSIGYTPDEMIGRPMTDFYSDPRDREKIVKAIVDGKGKARHVESSLRHKDGSSIWVSTNAYVRLDENGNAVNVEGIARNISDRKEMEINLSDLAETQSRLNEELTRESDIKDRFFTIISHDLQNPFNVLLNMTQLMSQQVETMPREKLAEYARGTYNTCEQVYDLLQGLLDWSQLQLNGSEFRPEALNLSNVVSESMKHLEHVAKEKNIQLACQMNNTKVYADQNMIQMVIRNLVSNALKFTDSGGTVEVSALEIGDKIQISVKDSGNGMEPDYANRIFALDEKTTRSGTLGEPGTGLGLPICKDILERNGGTIWVESILGQGSTFFFTLPAH